MFSSRNERIALLVAIILFGLSAIGHFWRILNQIPVTYGNEAVPIWYSVLGGIAALLMAVWLGSLLRRHRPVV